MDENRRKLQKSLRQQASKIGEGKSDAEMGAIISDTQIAIRDYCRARRKQLWDDFWRNFNDPKLP